jgi:hypothetical protein
VTSVRNMSQMIGRSPKSARPAAHRPLGVAVSRVGAAEASTPSGRDPSASIRGIAVDLAMVARPSGRDPTMSQRREPRSSTYPRNAERFMTGPTSGSNASSCQPLN